MPICSKSWSRKSRTLAFHLALATIVGEIDFSAAFNYTTNYDIIQQSWSGAAHAPDKTKALYLVKPTAGFDSQKCAPATGYPSQCPIELMSMTLNPAPSGGAKLGFYSFNISFFGNTFINSPNSAGYYGMPNKCEYQRNHTVLAQFNDTAKTVKFQIVATTSDYNYCSYPSFTSLELNLLPGQRCNGRNCYPNLVNCFFEGIYQLTIMPDGGFKMEITLAFPYNLDNWYNKEITNFDPVCGSTDEVLAMGTDLGTDDKKKRVIMYTLAAPNPWRPTEWFADRRPKITGIVPSFGPEEGGTIITIQGQEFSSESVFQRKRSVLLSHDGPGGVERECCDTTTVSDKVMTCRLPRVSCLSSNPTNPCPKPGQTYMNQTVSIAIRPAIKGFDPAFKSDSLDDFVRYEGEWELVDEDVYGGLFVPSSNVISGEIQILKTARKAAVASAQSCCPICATPGDPTCKITISQATTNLLAPQPGIYTVTIPAFMNPGGPGVCDSSTNFVNASLTMGIERSTDPKGFTPAKPLSITSCMDQIGRCRLTSRVSIRVTCNQLVWSTGAIESSLPPGQTVESFFWQTDSQCDRRMRCVGGACMWTRLTNTSGAAQPKLQRRIASTQIGLQIAWMDPFFTAPATLSSYISEVATRVIPAPVDVQRVQLLQAVKLNDIDLTLLGSTFAVREAAAQPRSLGTRSSSALCEPTPPYTACTLFAVIFYFLADGPGTLGSETVAQGALESMASSPFGSPMLREINVYKVCFDLSNIPAQRSQNVLNKCYKVQYPGILQLSAALTHGGSANGQAIEVRVSEEVWSYASVAVTRTGGSDLGCTLDYRTVDYNGSGFATGQGVDFTSKVGQLRWVAGETTPKYIVVPIRSDGITELDETFEVWVYNVINASMVTNDTQRAVVTIVGINDWPQPLYIDTTLRTIGAVCGAATAVPCALYLARLIRSVRRDMSRAAKEPIAASAKEEKADKADKGAGGRLSGLFKSFNKGRPSKPAKPKAIASA